MKVAVTDWSAFDTDDQEKRLSIDYYKVWGENPPVLLALIDALEIRILREEDSFYDKEIRFNWWVTDYSQTYIDIQLDIHNPENIAETGVPDTISVTFWGTRYF